MLLQTDIGPDGERLYLVFHLADDGSWTLVERFLGASDLPAAVEQADGGFFNRVIGNDAQLRVVFRMTFCAPEQHDSLAEVIRRYREANGLD